MIQFVLDSRSGTSPYLQLVEQVKRALLLENLHVGDQLPTIREVVAAIAINPNTVLKAYRQLEQEGIISSKPGVGTFIARSLAANGSQRVPELRLKLLAWLTEAREAGLGDDTIAAIFEDARRPAVTGGTR